jgi:hypothetical protein
MPFYAINDRLIEEFRIAAHWGQGSGFPDLFCHRPGDGKTMPDDTLELIQAKPEWIIRLKPARRT